MSTQHAIAALLSACLLLPAPARAAEPELPKKTALDDYVNKADPSYSWKLAKTIPGDGVTTYVLDLTSQTWRKPPDVDRAEWKHWVTIVKPDKVRHDTAFLMIGGGANRRAAPTGPNERIALLAPENCHISESLPIERVGVCHCPRKNCGKFVNN